MPLATVLVDDRVALAECLRDLQKCSRTALAMDAEGNKLGRLGTLSTLQIYPLKGQKVYIIDFTVMGSEALAELDGETPSLRAVLEGDRRKVGMLDPNHDWTCKTDGAGQVFFDVRGDANALFYHYGVELAGVYDLQLLDIAVRHSQRKYMPRVSGLGACFSQYAVLDDGTWDTIKDAGLSLFAPEKGGSRDVWDARPLDPALIAYASQDVAQLFELEKAMTKELRGKKSGWDQRIINESAHRVAQSQTDAFVTGAKENAIAPGSSWGR